MWLLCTCREVRASTLGGARWLTGASGYSVKSDINSYLPHPVAGARCRRASLNTRQGSALHGWCFSVWISWTLHSECELQLCGWPQILAWSVNPPLNWERSHIPSKQVNCEDKCRKYQAQKTANCYLILQWKIHLIPIAVSQARKQARIISGGIWIRSKEFWFGWFVGFYFHSEFTKPKLCFSTDSNQHQGLIILFRNEGECFKKRVPAFREG